MTAGISGAAGPAQIDAAVAPPAATRSQRAFRARLFKRRPALSFCDARKSHAVPCTVVTYVGRCAGVRAVGDWQHGQADTCARGVGRCDASACERVCVRVGVRAGAGGTRLLPEQAAQSGVDFLLAPTGGS